MFHVHAQGTCNVFVDLSAYFANFCIKLKWEDNPVLYSMFLFRSFYIDIQSRKFLTRIITVHMVCALENRIKQIYQYEIDTSSAVLSLNMIKEFYLN